MLALNCLDQITYLFQKKQVLNVIKNGNDYNILNNDELIGYGDNQIDHRNVTMKLC